MNPRLVNAATGNARRAGCRRPGARLSKTRDIFDTDLSRAERDHDVPAARFSTPSSLPRLLRLKPRHAHRLARRPASATGRPTSGSRWRAPAEKTVGIGGLSRVEAVDRARRTPHGRYGRADLGGHGRPLALQHRAEKIPGARGARGGAQRGANLLVRASPPARRRKIKLGGHRAS